MKIDPEEFRLEAGLVERNRSTLPGYPHTPTHPQALQKSQPSLLITA